MGGRLVRRVRPIPVRRRQSSPLLRRLCKWFQATVNVQDVDPSLARFQAGDIDDCARLSNQAVLIAASRAYVKANHRRSNTESAPIP